MKTEDIVKYLLIAAGAYLVWEYVISPMLATPAAAGTAPAGTGAAAPAATTTTTTQTTQPPATTNTTTQISTPAALQTLLATAANNPQFGLTADLWSYYYAQLPNRTAIPAATFSTMLTNLDITDATRSTAMISAQQFVGALNSVGLSGVGQTTKTNLRGGFSGRRPNAFSGSGGGSGRRLQTIH